MRLCCDSENHTCPLGVPTTPSGKALPVITSSVSYSWNGRLNPASTRAVARLTARQIPAHFHAAMRQEYAAARREVHGLVELSAVSHQLSASLPSPALLTRTGDGR